MNQTIKIYRINKGHRLLDKKPSTELIIKTIIDCSYKTNNIKKQFDVRSLKQFSIDDITYFLHVFTSYETVSDWEEFLPDNLTEDEDFTQQNLIYSVSLVVILIELYYRLLIIRLG